MHGPMARPAPSSVPEAPAPAPAPPEVDPDTPIEIRFLGRDEGPALTACIERCYGDTYDARWVYDADEIGRRIDSGILRSVVGVAAVAGDDGGEIVGHLALGRRDTGAPVGEAGQAVVDPRFRSHHLFTSLKRRLAEWAGSSGLLGIYSEATAAHPYSQKANLALGARETGFLLGYIPASVDYVGIDKAAGANRRQSAAVFYLQTNAPPREVVHPPTFHRDALGALYAHVGLPRDLASVDVTIGARSDLVVGVDAEHNDATITVATIGTDLADVLEVTVGGLAAVGVDCVYLDLALADPATARLPRAVHDDLGFFFGAVIPELRGGDVLRLQLLNGVDADPSDVAVASDFGRELLDYVFQRKVGAAVRSG
jgi:hypothetical protein